MKQKDARRAPIRSQPMELDEITIGGIPPLQHGWRRRLTPEELSPKGLQVTAGNPPGGRIDYLALH
jgi:hypothetical protein